MWWSAEAMTQASTGFRGPQNDARPHRRDGVDGGLIITVAVFTAGVTTALTTASSKGWCARSTIWTRVGWRHRRLGDNGLSPRQPHPLSGLRQCRGGADGVAERHHRRLALRQAAARLDGAAAVLLDGRGARDGLRPAHWRAAAFQPGSTLRKPFDIALLEEIKSGGSRRCLAFGSSRRSERKAVGIRQCREHFLPTAYCPSRRPVLEHRDAALAIGGAAIEGAVAFGKVTGRKSRRRAPH